MAEPFDPRLTAARGDLAASTLRGRLSAERYVDGESFEVGVPIAAVTGKPSRDASLLTQALLGERVMIFDRTNDGWSWGQLEADGYVGWFAPDALRRPAREHTHRVAALRTFAFATASIKTPPLATLPMGSRLTVLSEDGGFAVTEAQGHVPRQHLAPLDAQKSDFVTIAEGFAGTPYLWGGKSSLGIDCSGLVQVSLNACGRPCLRDSDMQQRSIGEPVELHEIDALRRGDLVFWRGHVAIARDAETLVHANAHHMATAIEPTREAVARILAAGSAVSAIRRPT
jgi:cell wall-associated NlpC family hydrolase